MVGVDGEMQVPGLVAGLDVDASAAVDPGSTACVRDSSEYGQDAYASIPSPMSEQTRHGWSIIPFICHSWTPQKLAAGRDRSAAGAQRTGQQLGARTLGFLDLMAAVSPDYRGSV
jgi:hypothetical protein